jgi:YD repeat-containing protein
VASLLPIALLLSATGYTPPATVLSPPSASQALSAGPSFDPSGNTRRVVLDPSGRESIAVLHAGVASPPVSEVWSYDARGRLLAHVGPEGVQRTWQYDDRNRVVRATLGDRAVTFAYAGCRGEALDLPCTETRAGEAPLEYEYTAHGDTLRVRQGGALLLEQSFDLAGAPRETRRRQPGPTRLGAHGARRDEADALGLQRRAQPSPGARR